MFAKLVSHKVQRFLGMLHLMLMTVEFPEGHAATARTSQLLLLNLCNLNCNEINLVLPFLQPSLLSSLREREPSRRGVYSGDYVQNPSGRGRGFGHLYAYGIEVVCRGPMSAIPILVSVTILYVAPTNVAMAIGFGGIRLLIDDIAS